MLKFQNLTEAEHGGKSKRIRKKMARNYFGVGKGPFIPEKIPNQKVWSGESDTEIKICIGSMRIHIAPKNAEENLLIILHALKATGLC